MRRDWFTMVLIRLFLKSTLDKEHNADFNRLDNVLAEMQDADKMENAMSTPDVIPTQV
jgi:hypothetical protein